MSFASASKPYKAALKIQDRLMRDIESEETAPSARAQAANAWEKIEERKRILRGAPLPGSLRPDKAVKKSKQPQAAPMEWIEPEPTTDARATAKPQGTTDNAGVH